MRVSYYDVVLGLIPATLLVVSGSLYSAGVDYTTAVPVGGLMAVLIVGHALFIRGPVSQIDTDTIEAANQPVEQSIPNR